MFHSSLYTKSPRILQELMLSWRARIRQTLRGGKTYRQLLASAFEREHWSSAQHLGYQQDELRRILIHAFRHVPYYADTFRKAGFNPFEADLPGAIRELPLLSKRDIISAGERLRSNSHGRYKRLSITGSTSGTTGTPVTIVQDLAAINREHAFISRQLNWAGYKPGEPRAWLRGDMVIPSSQTSPPFWRENRAENMLMMSSYHLSERTAPDYLDALNRYKPKLVQAFPSAISFLARFLESCGMKFGSPYLRAIVTSSEQLSDCDRIMVENNFGCKVFDWYGTFERVAAIGTCEEGTYHLMSDYSYVEFAPVGGGLFEVIGTGFNNYLMPLIRFRTGDLVELPAQEFICPCGRNFPVVTKIYGRSDDYIKLSDGRRIARLGYIFSGISGIAEAQIIQDELDAIRILVVPFEGYSAEGRGKLIENARQRLGAGVAVKVEIVSAIPRTNSGKFRTIVCNI